MLRWLRPDDADRLVKFYGTHTAETVFSRYGYARAQMTPEQALRLVNVDQTRDAALGVFERHEGQSRLIAIGRYCFDASSRSAELAFVVHEQRRNLGIGSALLRALIIIARERGLDRLTAQVQHDNGPMLHLLHHAGATFESVADASCTRAVLAV